MALNITTAAFQNGTRATKTAALWQYDYGQILNIAGLTLPDAWEAHFANTPRSGEATTSIGTGTQVLIPDAYLATGQTVYCWIFLHEEETDGETEYTITIPVNQRPIPTDEQPTPEQQGVIEQLMGALAGGVQKAEDAADRAEQAATTAGYMIIGIDADGHLIYTRTDQVDVDFALDNSGHLVMEGV